MRRLGALVAVALFAWTSTSEAQQGIKVLIPSDDTCNAFIAALNSSDRSAMLDLGGWALGYLSGVAQQSGKDILHDVTSQSVMDRIADACQRQPNRDLSSIVIEIGNALLAQSK
jgi:HdeA/HdeB family protein